MSVTDEPGSRRPTAGVDWATDDHAVAIVDPDGEQTGRFPVTHDAAGLRTLVRKLLAAGVAEVGNVAPLTTRRAQLTSRSRANGCE